MIIIDCFLFFNELDLLEIRLNELSPYVDKFLIVESRHTFQGDPKPLYFYENLDRFEKFKGRIIHVVEELPEGKTYEHGWDRERASRDAISKGLEGIPGDAIILLSDLDEIPNLVGWDANREVPACWSHTLHYYYVDLEIGPIKGTVAIPLKMFRENKDILGSGSKLREWRHYNPKFVFEGTRGGWHFSYLGGVDAIQAKIKAFAHAELNPHATKENIRKALEENWKNDVDLFNRNIYKFKHVQDGDLPQYLRKNKEKLSHFWMPDKLPLPCALKELSEEVADADVERFDGESPAAVNVVDSGAVVLGLVHDTLSDMVQEGYFEKKCASSAEPAAPSPDEPGPSKNETTEQPSLNPPHAETTNKIDPTQELSKILDEAAKIPPTGTVDAIALALNLQSTATDQQILDAYMKPAVEVIGKKIEDDLLALYQGFESEQQAAKLPDPLELLQTAESLDQLSDPTKSEQ